MSHDPLATLEAWTSTPDRERPAILASLARALGMPWRAGRSRVGRHGLGELVHDALGQGFVVVPGGWLRMGFSVDDIFIGATLREDGGDHSPWGGTISRARPTRWVRIRPYLLAIAGLPPTKDSGATDGGSASVAYRDAVKAARREAEGDDARALAQDAADEADAAGADPAMLTVSLDQIDALIPAGFRLPTEAELEWAFREGGTTRWIGVAPDHRITAETRGAVLCGDLTNGFGLLGFRDVQNPCADGAGWYDGDSPTDQRARNADADGRIARWGHTYWQDDDAEMMGMHAAARSAPDEYGDTILRLAADLPLAADVAEPPEPLAEHDRTLAALTGDDTRARNDALVALGHLASGRGHDAAATVAAVIDVIPALAPPLRARMLRWLADVQVAGHFDETVREPERLRPAAFADRADSRAAIAAAAPAIARQLADDDPDVRSAAALALAFCPAAVVVAPALLGRLAVEDVAGVRAGILLALARLGAPLPAGRGGDPVSAAAIAIGTAFDGAPDLDGLIEATELGHTPHLAHGRGWLGNIAIGMIERLEDAGVQHRAALAIARRAERDDEPRLASTALRFAFGEATGGRPLRGDELSAGQRATIDAILELSDPGLAWHAHGLPATPTGRRRLLARSSGGPSDQLVRYDGHERTLAYALRDLQWRAAEGDAAASAARDALLATLSPVAWLGVFLDRGVHGLDQAIRGRAGWAEALPDAWELLPLIAAANEDRLAARAMVDQLVGNADRPRGHLELVRAVIATRAPSEPIAPALLAELDDAELGNAADVLACFPRADVEARLLAALAPSFERALAQDRWQIGVDSAVERWAAVLAVAPSAVAARQMLILGWASGQPASVREAVAAHGADPAIAAVLADYAALPEFTTWPRARAGLADFARRA